MAKPILVAPLNWGLGHATRCIPIIRGLKNHGFTPIIGCDGMSASLLHKEFPDDTHVELPSYGIRYPKSGKQLRLKLLQQLPTIISAIQKEKRRTDLLVSEYNIEGIISDNRFGVHCKKIPSVFITHQLNVLSGATTNLTSKMHQRIIQKFDECWIPDYEDFPNLSGKLGHSEQSTFRPKYIGSISRFQKMELEKDIDITILLSGPEPQRSILENKLIEIFKDYDKTVLLIRGVIEANQTRSINSGITIINFMNSEELEQIINTSKLIISRSGYTTIMDLAKLNKKVFFIPTPGQFEQEYLADHLEEMGLAASCKQSEFNVNELERVDNYQSLNCRQNNIDFDELFSLFQRK